MFGKWLVTSALVLCLACWGSPAWAVIAYVQESEGQGDTSATTVAVAQTGVAVGNAKVCWVKYEGATTTITVSDGTSSLTADTLGQQTHSNNNFHAEFFYLLSSVASGSVTYTATFGASVPYRVIMCWEYSYSGTLVYDTSQFGQGSSTSLASGNITTTGTDEVVVAGYGEFSAETLSSMQINGVAANHTHQLFSPNFTATWDRVVSATFTGQATATIAASADWMVHVLALKIAGVALTGCRLLQDGTSFRLLQDGTSKRLLQGGAGTGCAGGSPPATNVGWYGPQGWY